MKSPGTPVAALSSMILFRNRARDHADLDNAGERGFGSMYRYPGTCRTAMFAAFRNLLPTHLISSGLAAPKLSQEAIPQSRQPPLQTLRAVAAFAGPRL